MSKKVKELVKRKEVKNSPFHIVTIKKESFGVLGKHRLTEMCNSVEECENELNKITWDRIIQVVMVLAENGILKEKID